jgi:hypothetical protein
MTVYYAQRLDPDGEIRPFIKIGYSKNPDVRMRGLMAALLATEPGNATTEAARHSEFEDLRVKGEYFRAEEPLLTHVRELMERPSDEEDEIIMHEAPFGFIVCAGCEAGPMNGHMHLRV